MVNHRRDSNLSEKKPSLEVLNQILNTLKGYEEDFGKLVSRLREANVKAGLNEEQYPKFAMAETKISTIKNEISSLVQSLSTPTVHVEPKPFMYGPPVIIRCKQWEDFHLQASNASTVSFLFKEGERAFQADALKQGKVYTYSGQLPNSVVLLRMWLSKTLNIPEDRIIEGILAIG